MQKAHKNWNILEQGYVKNKWYYKMDNCCNSAHYGRHVYRPNPACNTVIPG